jgi:uncharacterized damage-inducible protein DinB
MPVFFSFAQVREDLARHMAGIRPDAVWKTLGGNSLGFQLKHIAGSVDRLTTYLMGDQLSAQQLAFLPNELQPPGTVEELVAAIDQSLAKSEEQLRRLNPASLYERRSVGRQALPTSVLGLLIHLCEHTQRHLGQAIIFAKMLR